MFPPCKIRKCIASQPASQPAFFHFLFSILNALGGRKMERNWLFTLSLALAWSRSLSLGRARSRSLSLALARPRSRSPSLSLADLLRSLTIGSDRSDSFRSLRSLRSVPITPSIRPDTSESCDLLHTHCQYLSFLFLRMLVIVRTSSTRGARLGTRAGTCP